MHSSLSHEKSSLQSFKDLMNNPYKYLNPKSTGKMSEILKLSMHQKFTPKKDTKTIRKLSVKRLQTYTPRYLRMTESVQRKSVILVPEFPQPSSPSADLEAVRKP